VIETERLLLRLPEAGDAIGIAEQLGDAHVMRYIGTGETGDLGDAVERLELMQKAWADDGFGRFIAVRKTDGAPIGRVGLLAWDPGTWRNGTRAEIGDHAEIELGWTLARSAWGRGFATEAAAAVRDWAFREVGPPRLISLIDARNERSIRVAVKIGEHFEHEIHTHRGIPAQLWTF
jgi:RimJ/RimL family protein N-acetyltransferase